MNFIMGIVCVGVILILLYVLNEKTNELQETQEELTNFKREISNIDYHRQKIMSEANSYHARKIAETDKICAKKWNEITQKQDFVKKNVRSKISVFPEVATVIADFETAVDKMRAKAEEVRTVRKEKRELIKRIKALEIEDSLMEPVNASDNTSGASGDDIDNAGIRVIAYYRKESTCLRPI